MILRDGRVGRGFLLRNSGCRSCCDVEQLSLNGAGDGEGGLITPAEGGSGDDGFEVLPCPSMSRAILVDMLDERFNGFPDEPGRVHRPLMDAQFAQNPDTLLFVRGGDLIRQSVGGSRFGGCRGKHAGC